MIGLSQNLNKSNMSAEKQYIDLYDQTTEMLCDNSVNVMNLQRSAARQALLENGLVGLNTERYRHTDMEKIFAPDYGVNLKRMDFPINPYDAFKCGVPNIGSTLFFVVNDSFYNKDLPKNNLPENVFAGSLHQFAEKYPDIAEKYYGKAADVTKEGSVALNTLLAQDGFVLYVREGTQLDHPIQIVHIATGKTDLMTNRRVLVIIERNAKATLLVCDHNMSSATFLNTQVTEIFAEENASLDYTDLEESSLKTTRVSNIYAKLKANANVWINGTTLLNGTTRNNYQIDLDGEGAYTSLSGMVIADNKQKVDTHSLISHHVPHCESNELFKYVLNDEAIGAFNGRVLVDRDAIKTIANQTNRNLCATNKCRMYSEPQLVINADDVKCSHGMTTGQLDENALFYMRQRGIPEATARKILSVAFTADVIDRVRLDAIRTRLTTLTEDRFSGKLSRCATGTCKTCSKNLNIKNLL